MDQPQFRAPQNFINREIAALEFNSRVLALARDSRVPLLERLRFLCICSSNLDEFFEIRVSGLKQLLELGSTQTAPDTLSIPEQLAAIHERTLRLIEDQYGVLNGMLLGELHSAGIELLAGTVPVAPRGRIQVKGVEEPVPVFEVLFEPGFISPPCSPPKPKA